MNIPYYIRRTYGNDRLYIADPTLARSVSFLTGRQTINDVDIRALEALGHTLHQVSDPRGLSSDRRVYANIPLTVGKPWLAIGQDILAPSEDSDR